MFTARQRPLLVVEDRLLALRLSLNTPVVATAELAAGPARAAIVAYADGSRRRFGVIVRSLDHGVPAVYELDDEDLNEESGWAVALDAALSFGESMGFLFDDEVLVDRRPETLREAFASLREILAPPDVTTDDGPRAGAPPPPVSEESPEILLEDALDRAPGGGDSGADPAGAPVAAAPPPVQLSKFRGAPAEGTGVRAARPVPACDATSRAGTTLGRVRPVRRRAAGPDAPAPADALVRLLADF